MIRSRFNLSNICRGRFINPGGPRSGGFTILPHRFFTQNFRYPLDPAPADGTAPVVTAGIKAPYCTIPWLQRVALYPLSGNTDADFVPGYVWPSSRGWNQPNKLVRIPRTLFILTDTATVGGDVVFDINTGLPGTAFQTAMDAAVGPLNALGVDVVIGWGPCRFCLPCPATSVTETFLYTSNFFPDAFLFVDRYTITPTYTDPLNLNGGDVFILLIGDGPSGFPVTYSGDDTHRYFVGYYEVSQANWFNINPPVFPITPPGGDSIDSFTSVGAIQTEQSDLYAMPTIASVEAAAMSAIAARCRRFRVDVTSTDSFPVDAALPLDYETVVEADVRFRNGLNGSAYEYDPTDTSTLVNTLITRALSFFA